MSDYTPSLDANQLKTCRKCGELRPIADFTWSSAKRNGKMRRHRRGTCRLCRNNSDAKRRRNQARTREHVPVSEKRCSGCLKVLPSSLFGVARREPDGLQGHCNVCRKAYRVANKERETQRVLVWQRANMGKMLEKQTRWYHKNLDKARLIGRIAEERRRTRKTQAGGDFGQEEWLALCVKYDNRCLSCGSDAPLTADHIVPVSLGGTSNIDNIQPLCQSCNSKKGNRTIDYRLSQEVTHDN